MSTQNLHLTILFSFSYFPSKSVKTRIYWNTNHDEISWIKIRLSLVFEIEIWKRALQLVYGVVQNNVENDLKVKILTLIWQKINELVVKYKKYP